MDYKQIYETLLQTLCEAYNKMFKLLEQIETSDEALSLLTAQNRPDVQEICAITSQKDQLIQTLDHLSISIEPIHMQLDGIKALCYEVCEHPLYHHLENLQLLNYYYLRKVINNEDIRNPEIIDRLNDYKASLELDVKIREVPQSHRQVFRFGPEETEKHPF